MATPAGRDEGEPAPLSSDLERALLCERLNWQVLPHELDEVEVARLAGPLNELYAYRTFQAYGRDLKSLDAGQADLVAWVERMKELTPPTPNPSLKGGEVV